MRARGAGLGRAIGLGMVAVATMLAVCSLAAALFLNPVWVGFEQDRSNVSELTGYTPQEVRSVTGSILSDLIFGPPDFDVTVAGSPVLDAREKGHMVDVRNVFVKVGLVFVAAWVVLVAGAALTRAGGAFWLAVRYGALILCWGVLAVGAWVLLLFDQSFELMHETFFPSGTYTFDPSKERLVQLFPNQFWSDTSVALAGVILLLAVLLWLAAGFLGQRVAGPTGGAPAEGEQAA